MPTSHLFQLNQITHLIKLTNPQTVLDIGVGFGKYGVLAREFLEFWDGREKWGDWTRSIDGIEAFEEYITPMHHYIYNTIHTGDARKLLPTIDRQYDMIMLIDVLEHFCYEDGLQVLEECRRIGRNILVSVPRILLAQGDAFGNVFETHRFQWRKKHFHLFDRKFFVKNRFSLICFAGDDYRDVLCRMRKELKVNVWKEKIRPALVFALEDCHLKEPVKQLFRRVCPKDSSRETAGHR